MTSSSAGGATCTMGAAAAQVSARSPGTTSSGVNAPARLSGKARSAEPAVMRASRSLVFTNCMMLSDRGRASDILGAIAVITMLATTPMPVTTASPRQAPSPRTCANTPSHGNTISAAMIANANAISNPSASSVRNSIGAQIATAASAASHAPIICAGFHTSAASAPSANSNAGSANRMEIPGNRIESTPPISANHSTAAAPVCAAFRPPRSTINVSTAQNTAIRMQNARAGSG